jgi:hypothetical protein
LTLADVDGEVLLTLTLEDLKEKPLRVGSLGKWKEIPAHNMRGLQKDNGRHQRIANTPGSFFNFPNSLVVCSNER